MKVSIIMATYNAEKFIIAALSAIQNQTYKDFECILVDDYSTDSTVSIIYNMFCKNDRRFKLYVNCTDKNNPYIDAHNMLYSLATGDYIIHLDDDDVADKTMVEKYVEFMDNHPEYEACCCTLEPKWSNESTAMLENRDDTDELSEETKVKWFDMFPTDDDTDEFNKNSAFIHIFRPYVWCNQCSCIRKEFLDKHPAVIKYYVLGDYLFWLEFFANGGKAYKFKDKLLKYRIHRGSITHSKNWGVDNNYFQRDIAIGKIKILESFNNPEYGEYIEVFKNTVDYFNDLIEKEQKEQ